jgi:DNA-binding GntR family transcriptional regulator
LERVKARRSYAMRQMTMTRREDRPGNADRPGTVVRNMPMHDQILPHLRKDIVENRWKSGERLPEPQLCREFGISRTPLRQALKTLELEGLVQLIPHVGAVVTDPNAADVGEIMEILIGLEQLAAIRVAQSQRPEVLREIEAIYREMQQAAKQNAADRYYDLNNNFHRSIVSGAGNRSLAELHEKVMWHVHRERYRAAVVEPFTEESAEHHEEIVRAILENRAEEAGLAMRRHLEQVAELMMERRLKETELAKSSKGGKSADRSTRLAKRQI